MKAELGSVSSVVVAAPNWVGDVVMATPVFRAVREHFPQAHVTLLIRAYVSKVLNGAPWFDRVVEIEGRSRSLAAVITAARALRSRPVDLAVVLPNSFRSAFTVWLGGARYRVGYERDGRGPLLSRSLARPQAEGVFQPVYMGDYYLALLRALGLDPGDRRLGLFVTAEEEQRCSALLASLGLGQKDRFFLLNPGAAWGSSKCWPPERFARTADQLAERTGLVPVISSGPGEREIVEAITAAMDAEVLAPDPEDLPLDLLKPLVRRAAFLVTNDTGPRHFANAFGTPSVVIMGPTDSRYTSDPKENAVVLQSDRDCVPCHLKTCPAGLECMLDITAEMVVDAAISQLGHS